MQRVRLSSQQALVHRLGDSQITLSPKFRVAAIQSSLLNPSPEFELSLQYEPLIPGLPDDIALSCLLRVPVQSHAACKAVCKRWHLLLGNKERFFTRRKELGFKDPWLFVFAFHKCTGKIQWHVLDLIHFSWHVIPAMPCKDKVCPHGVRCVSVANDGTLFVCGGMVSDVDSPLDLVLKYEMQKNRWTVMNRMITARSFFASGVIEGMIYVAGGNSSDLFELDSAEVLDPVKGNWRRIANMGTNMASYDAAVLDGKLLVTEGWLWPFFFAPRGQIYDPRTDKWENMAFGLREGWTGSSVVVYGRLFVVSDLERMKLKVYDADIDSWETIEGPPLPEQISKPFAVSACDCKIYVVGRNLHVVVGHISRLQPKGICEKKWSFSVRWHAVDPPDSFCDLTPSSSQGCRCNLCSCCYLTLTRRCGHDQISPATAQDSRLELCRNMYTSTTQKMMRYRRLESAWPGFGRGHLFDKLEEAAMKLDDLKKNHTNWEFIKKSGSSRRFKNCSSRWCEDDKLMPDSNVDENDIFKTELEHLVMGNEILQR